MWPSVEVTTAGAVFGYYGLLMLLLIGLPSLICYIFYCVWFRPVFDRKYQEMLDENPDESV